MEKFSGFQDPGTGIRPFIKLLPPTGSDITSKLLLPFGYALGTVRTLLLLVLGLLFAVLVQGVCLLLLPIPPLHRFMTHAITAVFARLALLLVGVFWIPVETVTRKRGRAKKPEYWKPKAGDIIVSNWASWVEVLWLAFRFNPIFVLPVASADVTLPDQSSTPLTRTPGRRTGTGSAAISSPSARKPTPRVNITGFRPVSLLSMLGATGHVPTSTQSGSTSPNSLEEIRNQADRPIVVFPECTTSNGRGLLRVADVFQGIQVPVTLFRVFIMSARYDLPTTLTPSPTLPISSAFMNPLPHMFHLTTSLFPFTPTIRLLVPSGSPSSGSFLLSEFLSEETDDPLSEVCATLIAQLGKMKRLGLGWEDKAAFLELYRSKK
ncbi:hypothetical protein CERSUDRAFT_111238 [Gelatoporia subvermispora B]|uniref:Phospholipid/glycerol acyltransferase domain-containing protein n=1 Tax=Ceriporiopsis subvermispora (strain B) TaxID=914234 RepID=M2RP67_CERS8|nr:hypothetical protein CERSUDRAFT_111238 [Gelatoporia subvermispora B]